VVSITTRSNAILPVALGDQIGQRLHQIAADRAADAAVAHLHDLLAAVLHQDLVVDVFFAELVLDHGDLHAVLLVEDALEQRGLAAAEEAGQDRDRNQFGHVVVLREKGSPVCQCADASPCDRPHSAQMPLTVSSTCSTANPLGTRGHGFPGRLQAERAIAACAVKVAVLSMDFGACRFVLHQREAEHAVVAGAFLRQALVHQPVQHAVHGHAVHVAFGRQAIDHGLVGQWLGCFDQAGQNCQARLRHTCAKLAQTQLRRGQRISGHDCVIGRSRMWGGACHAKI
jgi:hypothetical protein